MNGWRYALITAVTASAITAVMLHDRIPQDPAYHRFADRRELFGIPNWWNVVSNAPFLVAGLAGFVVLRAKGRKKFGELYCPYFVFFAGSILVAFGSAFYHLQPDNERLTFDRLPMTIAFAAFAAIVMADHFDVRIGRRVLLSLLAAGIASVLYWHMTELAGRGDLRPYLLAQFAPMALIPIVLVLFRSGFTTAYSWTILMAYAAAKVCEVLDRPIYATLGVSGHTLKHLAAAASVGVMVVAASRRRAPEQTEIQHELTAP